jgi:hypothetical protein
MQRQYFGVTRGFVQEFCSHCPVCQLKQAQTTRPPLQPIIETDFLNRIQVDLIDMRHNPDGEFNYIGHFMDHFSKFHILFPLRKKTAEEVSYMLEERVLAYLGPPKIFHSDNGREFVNNLIHAMFKRWGGDVTFVNGRPRHSQSQGLIERGNRTVEMKIAVMKQDEGHTGFKYPWVSWLPRIMFSMNSEKHEGIKDSPYHVVFGRHSPTGFFPGAVKHCVDEEDICTDGEKKQEDEAQLSKDSIALVHSPAKHLEPTASTSTSETDEPKSVAPVDTVSHPSTSAATQELSEVAGDEKISNEQSQHHSTNSEQESESDSGSVLDEKVTNTLYDHDTTVHTKIRKKALDNSYHSAARMSTYYNKKKGMKVQTFHIGDKVTVSIPKLDRSKTDVPRLPCVIAHVYGDKVKTYCLTTAYGTLKPKFRGGDLQSYDGQIDAGNAEVHLSLREAALKFHPLTKFTKSSCKCTSGCKSMRCICKKNGIECSTQCHLSTTCSNQFDTNLSLKSPLLSSSNRAILDTTEWLNDTHMDAANKLLKESFPAIDGLQNPVLQQNMSFDAPNFEFAQFLLVNKNHWLLISNIGEEMNTVCIYDSMQLKPDSDCLSIVSKYIQCSESQITINVMNVQEQEDSYSCGDLAVAFATSLIHGEDPTQLHYKQLRNHLKDCVDKFGIVPFPSTVVNRHPRIIYQIKRRVYCKCRSTDDGKLDIRCCACSERFHSNCVGISATQLKKWMCDLCSKTLL